MKKILALLLAVALFSPLPAAADLSGTLYPNTAPYKVFPGATSAALVVSSTSAQLVSIINTNTTAQTATVTCYDNASAASGTVLYAVVLGASQIVPLGIQAVNGITCNASAATVAGNGINILSR